MTSKFKGPVKVGAHTVQVVPIEESDLLDDMIGHFESSKGVIRIRSNLPESLYKETLLHELMHVAAYHWNCSHSQNGNYSIDELEENFVNGISSGIYLILKDNTRLRRYLFE